MYCPKCGRMPTYVIKTEMGVEPTLDDTKRRKRVCRNCRHSFYTFELSEAEFRKNYPLKEKEDKPEK